jgi:hypothetical protein
MNIIKHSLAVLGMIAAPAFAACTPRMSTPFGGHAHNGTDVLCLSLKSPFRFSPLVFRSS